ncbi:MAG: rhodanese-like domain-containing protein [Deltaproteobacteria bacterium]|nr:MAG: rhodanese-like domain-containing protein [Deltaproteobacteria bacterium]
MTLREISPEEAERLWQESSETLFLDVRTPEEHATVRIPRSKSIPIEELEYRLHELPAQKDASIVVYCATGRRSAVACEFLGRIHGYTGVVNLAGGIVAWNGAREYGLVK